MSYYSCGHNIVNLFVFGEVFINDGLKVTTFSRSKSDHSWLRENTHLTVFFLPNSKKVILIFFFIYFEFSFCSFLFLCYIVINIHDSIIAELNVDLSISCLVHRQNGKFRLPSTW